MDNIKPIGDITLPDLSMIKILPSATFETRQQPGEETDDRKYYRARISSNKLDSHFSEMDISTLENFAEEAANGVTVLDSHNHRTVGIGRSISGDLIENEVFSDFYILKGLDLNNQSFRTSDSFMKAIDAGMLQDVSVGFYGHREICQICDEELWGGKCRHWPGASYIIEEDGRQDIVVCTTLIVDGHLSEFSLVYDGALEGAEIVEKAIKKAERTLTDLNTKQKADITSKFGVDFDKIKTISKPDPEVKEEPELTKQIIKRSKPIMSNETLQERYDQLEADYKLAKNAKDEADAAAQDYFNVKAKLSNAVEDLEKANKRAEDAKGLYETEVKKNEALKKDNAELKPLAEGYKGILEEERSLALDARQKAYPGEDHNSQGFQRSENILNRSTSVPEIREYRDEWEEMSKKHVTPDPKLSSKGDDDHPEVSDEKSDKNKEGQRDLNAPQRDNY